MDGSSELSHVTQEVAWRSAQDETLDHLRTGTPDGAGQGPAGGPGEVWDGCWSQAVSSWRAALLEPAPAGRVSVTHGVWIFLQVTHSEKFLHCCESPHFLPFSSLLWTSPFYSTASSDFSSCTGKMSDFPKARDVFFIMILGQSLQEQCL